MKPACPPPRPPSPATNHSPQRAGGTARRCARRATPPPPSNPPAAARSQSTRFAMAPATTLFRPQLRCPAIARLLLARKQFHVQRRAGRAMFSPPTAAATPTLCNTARRAPPRNRWPLMATRPRRVHRHQIGVVRDVGNYPRARRRQHRAERRADRTRWPGRCTPPDRPAPATVFGIARFKPGPRVNQRVGQQDRLRIARQFPQCPPRVRQPIPNPIGRRRRRRLCLDIVGRKNRKGRSLGRRSRWDSRRLRRRPASQVKKVMARRPEKPCARHEQQAQHYPNPLAQTHNKSVQQINLSLRKRGLRISSCCFDNIGEIC